MKEDTKGKQKFSMVLPVELEMSSRKAAYNLGFVYRDTGNLSGYVQLLIINDIKEKPLLDLSNNIDMRQDENKRVNISIDKDIIVKAEQRAEDLGFVWGESGNVSMYIKYLLIRELNKL